MRPGQSTYKETVRPINPSDTIIITDSLAKGIRENEINSNLRARNSRSVAFLEVTFCQLLYYIDVYLEHSVKYIVIFVRVNEFLYDTNQSSVENLVEIFKNVELMASMKYFYPALCITKE